jgi:hypothetical protein
MNMGQTISSIKNKSIIVFILILFFMQSCNRDEDVDIRTTFYGHLMVLGSEEVINDRSYKITVSGGGQDPIADIYTDENGYYEFEFYGLREEYLHFRINFDRSQIPNDNTFTGGVALISDPLELSPWLSQSNTGSYKGNTRTVPAGFKSWANVYLEKKAWLELEVENIDPQIGDRIRIHYVSHRGGAKWEYVFHHGQHWKIILPGVGNVDNYIDYWVHKDGTSIPKQRATIKLGEMDTTYFKLEY